MAKGSNYMRGLCIVLNFLLAISGVILLLFGIVAKNFQYAPVEQGWTQFVLLSVGIGLATILLSILGVYGAYREQVLPLLLYSVFMAIELTVIMVLAIIATLAQPQLEKEIQQNFGRIIPLENKPDVFQNELKKLQKEAQCCGLTKFTDWRDPPPSCLCPPDFSDKEVKCVPKNISELIKLGTEHQDTELVYNTECGPILMERAKKDWRVLLGILFTLATIEVAAVVVALLLWYKIHTQSPGTGHSQDNNSRTKYELQPDKMP